MKEEDTNQEKVEIDIKIDIMITIEIIEGMIEMVDSEAEVIKKQGTLRTRAILYM